VVFRLDASQSLGIGHLVRCLRIASEMRARGTSVHFVLSHFAQDWSGRLVESGFPVHYLQHQGAEECRCGGNHEWQPEKIWDGNLQERDAREFSALIKTLNISLIVLDHYGLDVVWEQAVSAGAETLVVIDDLANRRHDCDILVDYNFAKETRRYEELVPSKTKLMLGVKYAPLTEEHFPHDQIIFAERPIRRVFISMGGGMGMGFLVEIVTAVAQTFRSDVEIRVVLPFNAAASRKIMALIPNKNVEFLAPLPTLVGEYRAADLAIGAAGVAALERMALGVPSVTLITADNQVSPAEGMSIYTGETFLDARGKFAMSELKNSLIATAQARVAMQERAFLNQFLIDRFGLTRLVRAILPTSPLKMVVRQAKQTDCATYLIWANDPQVRLNSISQDQVETASHVRWFRHAISSTDMILYVGELDGLPFGQVRFQKEKNDWWLSYSIDCDFRGLGLGRDLIEMALTKFAAANPKTDVHGVVKIGNKASIKVLQSTGFVASSSNEDRGDLSVFTWANCHS
jgi:UDP-2,4-diacetamido-2,4,6-trideoxy-beta-L-altropyranose hydrolase